MNRRCALDVRDYMVPFCISERKFDGVILDEIALKSRIYILVISN